MDLPGRPCFRVTTAAVLGVAAMVAARGDEIFSAAGRDAVISAAAPFDVFASGFQELSAIAVDADGAALVTDRRAGTLTRIGASGTRETVLSDLHQPAGVAVDRGGTVFIIEGGTRVLRVDGDGSVSVVAASIKQARALAAGPDGRMWMAIRREQGPECDVVRLEPSGALTVFATGFVDVRGLAVDETAVYVAMASMGVGSGRERTTLGRIPLRADGRAGVVEPMLRNAPRRAYGVAIDAAGDLFVSGVIGGTAHGSGVILKRRAGGHVDTFASGLRDPVALAFTAGGDLLTIDRDTPAVVLRFRAPPVPDVTTPPFTNRTPLVIQGRATAGSLVRAFDASRHQQALAAVLADPSTGAFSLEATLAPNAETQLSFVATAAGGAGLQGPAITARIVHDDHLPSVTMTDPLPGTHARGVVMLRGRAGDEGSGVASMRFMRDELVVATVQNHAPGQPLLAASTLDTASMTEGPHALTVAATDRAGNTAAAAQLLVVDRTPPETYIVTGPPEEIAERAATVTFAGVDGQSPNLDFAWRLDEGPWSIFSASPAVELTSLGPGTHRFEVKARDRAGNEDPTPAARTFRVKALTIRILEPRAGAVLTTETVWVRGTVESGGREVSVTIPLPPEFKSELSLETLPAATEAGTFAAEVPVTPSMTTMTVTARDSDGATATDSVGVEIQSPLSASSRFEVFPSAGFTPLTTRLAPRMFPAGSFYSLDLESDGTVDHEGDTLSDREFVYGRPGIHVATLRVTTMDGQAGIFRASVAVYDRPTLEERVRAVWAGFRGALIAGDVARAAAFVHGDRRAAWEAYFRQFTPGLFAATDTVFGDVMLLDVAPGRAECEMMREVDGLLYSFPVSFQIDMDGGWRLWQF